MLTCLVSVLFTFYIHGVLKFKKNSGAKGLIYNQSCIILPINSAVSFVSQKGFAKVQYYTEYRYDFLKKLRNKYIIILKYCKSYEYTSKYRENFVWQLTILE